MLFSEINAVTSGNLAVVKLKPEKFSGIRTQLPVGFIA